MGKWEEGGGPSFTGYVKIGPPFEIVNEFRQLEEDWALGRWSATVTARVKGVLPYEVPAYSGDEVFTAPEEAIGHDVRFYLGHPLKNHQPDEDDPDRYAYLDTRWDRYGRPWPSFWTQFVLARAGFSTAGLTYDDDERLLQEVTAMLNAGGEWSLAIRESVARDIEGQIPPHTEVLATFHQFLYWDWIRRRPTWVLYTEDREEGPREVRQVVFLLRVVAPEEWAGVLLPVKMNYTIIRAQNAAGEDVWYKSHAKATFDAFMRTLGINVEEFVEDLPDELLLEVPVGARANLLAPLEAALQKAAQMGHLLHVTITENGRVNREAVDAASAVVIQRISGKKSFQPSPLRMIRDISEEQIAATTPAPSEESIPGFDEKPSPLEDESIPPATVASILNAAGRSFGCERTFDEDGALAPEGVEWCRKYLLPVYEFAGLDRSNPLEGWTQTVRENIVAVLADTDGYIRLCDQEAEMDALFGQIERVLRELGDGGKPEPAKAAGF